MNRIAVVQGLVITVSTLVIATLCYQIEVLQEEKEKAQHSLETWKERHLDMYYELEALKELDVKTIKRSTIHYNDWKKRERFVEKLAEESNGKFKTGWAYFLYRKANELNIDPYLVYELIKVETGGTFNPKLVGPPTKYGQAKGLTQIMPSNTAEWLASMAGVNYEREEMLFNPYYSMELTVTYLQFLYQEYENWNEVLTAYHRGMYGMEKYKEEHGHAKSWYANRILNNTKEHNQEMVALLE